jgi:hypothetical protein
MKQSDRQTIDSGQFTELFKLTPNGESELFVEFASGYRGGSWRVDRLYLGSGETVSVNEAAGDIVSSDGTNGQYFFDASTGYASWWRSTADSSGVGFVGYKSRGTLGSPTVLSAGDDTAIFRGFAYDGGAYREIGRIAIETDTVTGSDDISGDLSFYTRDDGAAAAITRRWYLIKTGAWAPYTDDTYDIGTSTKQVRDVYLGKTVQTPIIKTSGSPYVSTFTGWAMVVMVAGGAGGSGGGGAVATGGGGGGGGGGFLAYLSHFYFYNGVSYPFTIGSGGTGGTAGANTGGNGGASTISSTATIFANMTTGNNVAAGVGSGGTAGVGGAGGAGGGGGGGGGGAGVATTSAPSGGSAGAARTTLDSITIYAGGAGANATASTRAGGGGGGGDCLGAGTAGSGATGGPARSAVVTGVQGGAGGNGGTSATYAGGGGGGGAAGWLPWASYATVNAGNGANGAGTNYGLLGTGGKGYGAGGGGGGGAAVGAAIGGTGGAGAAGVIAIFPYGAAA